MIWVLLLSPVWAGRTIPQIMADFIIVLSVYWFYRACVTTIGVIIGYERYRRARKKDWLQLCNDLSNYELPERESLPVSQFLPKHLIVYPVAASTYEVLHTTFTGLQNQNYPKELMYIAISFEQWFVDKDPTAVTEMETKLRQNFPEFGDRLMIFYHPADLPGEVRGAGPNRTWGARNAVEELERRDEIISDFLVTSPDEDLVFHREFLAAATYKYLTTEKRKQRFYQTALYTFNNNYWDVPILIRVVAASLTLPVLASSTTERHKRETYSCYTISLEVLKKVGYWDVSMGIDDTTFYWRPYFYFKGDWECEVFYIPLSADAVYDSSYVNNHRAQYKQYVRWGWGVISFPIGFKGLIRNTSIPLWKRLQKLWQLFEVFVFFKVLAYLITFAIPLILLLNPEFNELSIWYTIPNTLSQIMGLAVVFIIPMTIYKILLAPPKPAGRSWISYFFGFIIEAPLNVITLLTFSSLPFIEASTRMMFGQKAGKVAWATKMRKNN